MRRIRFLHPISKAFQFLVNSTLLLTIAALPATEVLANSSPGTSQRARGRPFIQESFPEARFSPPLGMMQMQTPINSFSYDDVLDLIEELEEGDLEARCTPDELNRITQFMCLLARQGVLPGQSKDAELEADIQELLNVNSVAYSIYQDGDYLIIPAVYHGQGDFLLCKSWISKSWKATKNFVKKHKTAIIIGAAVVVAVVVVCVVVASAGTASGVAAAGAAGISGLSQSESEPSVHENHDRASPQLDSVTDPVNIPQALESTSLKTVLDDQIDSFKEMVVEDSLLKVDQFMPGAERALIEKARGLGSYLAHETLDGIAQLTSGTAQSLSVIKDFGDEFLPNGFINLENNDLFGDPQENFNRLVTSGHETVDYLFGTEQASHYATENKGNSLFLPSLLPMPPGLLSGVSSSSMGNGRITPTMASSTWGWKIGEPIVNRTIFGTVPTWSTVRRRFWKNEAYLNPTNYKEYDVERMRQGLAPQRLNRNTGQLESMELHHIPPQREGGLFDFIKVWPDEHAAIDPNRHLGQ